MREGGITRNDSKVSMFGILLFPFENSQIFNVEYECINYLLEGMSFNDVLDRGEAQGHRRSHLGAEHNVNSKKKSQELRVGKFIRQLGQGSRRQ